MRNEIIIQRRSKINGMTKEITLEEAITELEQYDSGTKLEFINDRAACYYFRMVNPQTNIFEYSISRREGSANFYHV